MTKSIAKSLAKPHTQSPPAASKARNRSGLMSEALAQQLLQSVQEMKAGKGKVAARIQVPAIVQARTRSGLSQAQFAQLLGVSVRTLQDWEQGRRVPSGAAQSLLRIALKHPEVVAEVLV